MHKRTKFHFGSSLIRKVALIIHQKKEECFTFLLVSTVVDMTEISAIGNQSIEFFIDHSDIPVPNVTMLKVHLVGRW